MRNDNKSDRRRSKNIWESSRTMSLISSLGFCHRFFVSGKVSTKDTRRVRGVCLPAIGYPGSFGSVSDNFDSPSKQERDLL